MSDTKPSNVDVDVDDIDLETKMHYVMQTLRYKIHTLLNAWDIPKARASTNTDEGKDSISMDEDKEKQKQWVKIISNHMYRFDKVLETALKSYNIEFDANEYEKLEMNYHRELFGSVVATNPMWLSVLMLAGDKTALGDNNSSNTLDHTISNNVISTEDSKGYDKIDSNHLDGFWGDLGYWIDCDSDNVRNEMNANKVDKLKLD